MTLLNESNNSTANQDTSDLPQNQVETPVSSESEASQSSSSGSSSKDDESTTEQSVTEGS